MYGDSAYPIRPQLQGPFSGANLTDDQNAWNESMSPVRTSIEWLFGDIENYFKCIDFIKNLKVQLSAIGKLLIVCLIIQDARTLAC